MMYNVLGHIPTKYIIKKNKRFYVEIIFQMSSLAKVTIRIRLFSFSEITDDVYFVY